MPFRPLSDSPRVLISALVAVALGACSPTLESGSDAVAERTAPAVQLAMSDAGVGGLTGGTAYSAKAVEAALPGFKTEGFQAATEDTTEWALGAYNSDGFQVLQIFKSGAGRIREIHAASPHVRGPNGERIGMSFAEIGTPRRDCRNGRNLWRGMAICEARGASNVTLVYAISQYDGPFDQLAPEGELRKATLQRMIWTPN